MVLFGPLESLWCRPCSTVWDQFWSRFRLVFGVNKFDTKSESIPPVSKPLQSVRQ